MGKGTGIGDRYGEMSVDIKLREKKQLPFCKCYTEASVSNLF